MAGLKEGTALVIGRYLNTNRLPAILLSLQAQRLDMRVSTRHFPGVLPSSATGQWTRHLFHVAAEAGPSGSRG